MSLDGWEAWSEPIIVAVCEADAMALEKVAEEDARKALDCFTSNLQTDREEAAFFGRSSVFAQSLGQKVCELAIPVADEYSTPIAFIALSVWERAFLFESVRKSQIRRNGGVLA